jgi:histidine ammonia-lyase
MTEDLAHVLALELRPPQALEYRQDMLNAARTLAARGDWLALASKVGGAPKPEHARYPEFEVEIKALMAALAQRDDFHAGTMVNAAFSIIRQNIQFMRRDRGMDQSFFRRVCELVSAGTLLKQQGGGNR